MSERIVETCECGAMRRTNRNGLAEERGDWTTPWPAEVQS